MSSKCCKVIFVVLDGILSRSLLWSHQYGQRPPGDAAGGTSAVAGVGGCPCSTPPDTTATAAATALDELAAQDIYRASNTELPTDLNKLEASQRRADSALSPPGNASAERRRARPQPLSLHHGGPDLPRVIDSNPQRGRMGCSLRQRRADSALSPPGNAPATATATARRLGSRDAVRKSSNHFGIGVSHHLVWAMERHPVAYAVGQSRGSVVAFFGRSTASERAYPMTS